MYVDQGFGLVAVVMLLDFCVFMSCQYRSHIQKTLYKIMFQLHYHCNRHLAASKIKNAFSHPDRPTNCKDQKFIADVQNILGLLVFWDVSN